MSYRYTFTDQATGASRYFYGYLYDCYGDTPVRCPYVMRLNNCYFCNHPNSRDYTCGQQKKESRDDL
jgi:hypothetical protein